ncbi:MAG: TetR family transcriptional regulator [Deltaproteobacteria bacterium]|nr:TetR family transcriptional regulator [Deltaproteobacteria bacterium]
MTASSTGRERNATATRQAILDAAEKLFSSQGFADTAMSQIAQTSAVTKSLIHHHFGSKAALWDEVRGRLKAEYLASQSAVASDDLPAAELLTRAITTYFRFLQSRPRVVRMMSWSLLASDPTHRWLDHGLNRHLIEITKAAQAEGSVRADLDPVGLLMFISATVEHYFESKVEFDELIPLDQATSFDETYLDNVIKIFHQGVLTSPKTPTAPRA